jgi:hypothetical protein
MANCGPSTALDARFPTQDRVFEHPYLRRLPLAGARGAQVFEYETTLDLANAWARVKSTIVPKYHYATH